jgi:phosphopantetheine adenylyltransferase
MATKKQTTVKQPIEQDITSDDNPIIYITLDRERELRFGHKALKRMSALTGKTMIDITSDEFSLEELEKVLWCGLISDAEEHGETLKLEDMEDLLDKAPNYISIINAMNDAMAQAFKETKKQKN